ncbi:MAG: zf-HC2 domain-containing protein [Acidobacteriota bacterium]|nr:zf-HC2 domain-containing protein [Acidobacteriota bacterium]
MLLSDQLKTESWRKRVEVRLHLALCRFCSRLARQIRQMRAAAQRMSDSSDPDAGLEERLVARLSLR